MSPLWPRYEAGSLALISSIAAYFGAPTGHATLKRLDELLARRGFRNAVMLLYDGLGVASLRQHLPEDSFLRRHCAQILSATYPSTTTAATTTLETGLSPAEHAWLGWSLYFPEISQSVDLFTNRNSETGEVVSEDSVAERYQPYDSIFNQINRAGQAAAGFFSAFSDPPAIGLEAIMAEIEAHCRLPGQHYYYGYWNEPDHTMHMEGVLSPEVHRIIQDLDAATEAFSRRLSPDTLLIVTADHGLVDAEHLYIEDHPALREALVRPPTVEPRAAAMYVKPAYMDSFPELFEAAFPGRFLLMTSGAAIDSGLFGPGAHHPRLKQNAGDYIALSLDHACLQWAREDHALVGVHAGLTADEMQVPLILCCPDGQ